MVEDLKELNPALFVGLQDYALLGVGTYGRVWRVVDLDSSTNPKMVYAVKQLNKLKTAQKGQPMLTFNPEDEAKILEKLTPICDEYTTCFRSLYSPRNSKYVYILMTYLDNYITLEQWAMDQRVPLPDYLWENDYKQAEHELKIRAGVACKLIEIVNVIHKLGIAHLDISSQNFLIKQQNLNDDNPRDEIPKVKIIDFGFACDQTNCKNKEILTNFPPQELIDKTFNKNDFDSFIRVDNYALGRVLYFLIYNVANPFDNPIKKSFFASIQEFVSLHQPKLYNLINDLIYNNTRPRELYPSC